MRSSVIVSKAEEVELRYWRMMRWPGVTLLCAPKRAFATAMCNRLTTGKILGNIMSLLRQAARGLLGQDFLQHNYASSSRPPYQSHSRWCFNNRYLAVLYEMNRCIMMSRDDVSRNR